MRAMFILFWLLPAGVLQPQAPISTPDAEVPAELRRWLGPQPWERDAAGPVLSLGEAGAFDDTHIFAPAVATDGGRFLMWYCGSRGFAHDLSPTRTADERVFKLGLAESADGKNFSRHPGGAVFAMDQGKMSVLTPCVLRHPDGSVRREDGRMRMWFSSAALDVGGPGHCIRETSSPDGVRWSQPSSVQLERAYAPAVVRTQRGYEMWYTEPGKYPWRMRHARSDDGRRWTVTDRPVLEETQDWEHYVMIYPAVTWFDGVYVMWYASYMHENRQTTAIGFAASVDGITWHKHPDNPVLRPDPRRSWESHYVSSHSVIRLPDGGFRMWYASRKEPPFTNLYFALNTARWSGPVVGN
jgi:predicted GH43/DUF377 family glycosyl hydrolase